ncbi:MAG TPA: caspase family protein, partial [Micromonosporaceae bacterium]|nr:caspase family protein [Micromonosporaceae bacterium]
MSENSSRRFLIATGTTHYPHRSDLDERPELVTEIDSIRTLFTGPHLQLGSNSRLGYQQVPGFGANLTSAELKQRLRAFLTAGERTSDDIVVFYYTGHGDVDDSGEFLFPLPDTTDDIVTTVPAGELARWLLAGTVVQRVFIILDTCHAGVAGGTMAARAISALSRLQGLANRPQVAILAATRPREQARSGAFTQALIRAIQHRASGGHEPRFLPLDAVTDVINADPDKPAYQHAQLFSYSETASEFIPNPRYDQWLRGLDLRTQLDREQRHERDREFQEHVLPRAQGLDAPQEGLWLFTGRHAALRELSNWLRDIERDGTARVITGDPGSGKSALLARLTVLARPEHLRKVPRLDQLPAETIPPRESVDVFIHARGQTGDQVLGALASAAGVEA